MSSIFLNKAVQQEKELQESINLADSTRLADSLRVADSLNVTDSLKTAKEDSLKLAKLHKEIKDKGHLSLIAPNANYTPTKQEYDQELLNLSRELVLHEAKTNANEDFNEYIDVRNQIHDLHKSFNGMSEDVQYAGGMMITPEYGNITDDPRRLTFSNRNKLDLIWANAMSPLSNVKDNIVTFPEITEDGSLVEVDMPQSIAREEGLDAGPIQLSSSLDDTTIGKADLSLENVTKSRIVASNPEIHNLIYGQKISDTEKIPGFYDALDEFDLDTEGNFVEGLKEGFNMQTMKSIILQEALQFKNNGRDWFYANERALIGTGNTDSYLEFHKKLKEMPEFVQKNMRKNLQKYVNEIYDIGMRIYSNDKLYDRYAELQKMFPEYSSQWSSEILDLDDHGNKDLDFILNKKEEIHNVMKAYQFDHNEKYSISQTLNQISVDALNEEIDKLSDEDRTSNFDELLNILSNEIQESDNLETFLNTDIEQLELPR